MAGLQEFYYNNLKKILEHEPVNYKVLSLDQHEELYKISVAHGIHLFVYESFKNSNLTKMNFDLFNKWKSKYLRKTLNQQQSINNIRGIFCGFKSNNIDVMILKGIAYSRYYKNPFARRMADLDLYVKAEDLTETERVLKGLGYHKSDNKGVDSHHIIFKQANNIIIELHTKLIDEKKFPELSYLSQDIFENTYKAEFQGIHFLSPKGEYELLYCLVHMYKHYYDVGFGFKQICDVYQIIMNHDMDWQMVFDKIENYKIRSFSMSILKIMNDYFDVNFPECYHVQFDNIEDKIMTLFLKDIYKSGAFGFHDKEKYLSNHIADHQFENKLEKSKFQAYKKYLFPTSDFMLGYKEFQYIKKHKYLLPFAWLQRINKHFKKGHLKKHYINQDLIQNRLTLKNWMTDS
jgi:hypothetical protein